MPDTPDSITELLRRMQTGDRASADQVLPLVYGELRRIAGRLLSAERADHTLQPTELVNEAFLRHLMDLRGEINDRQHFYGYAARAMRQILVEHARRRNAVKRSGGYSAMEFAAMLEGNSRLPADLLIPLDVALEELHRLDQASARVVDLRYFLGCTWEETAEVMNLKVSVVRRNWDFAKAHLATRLST